MPTLALSMIVRNGEKDIRACLNSVHGIVDEVQIADTGSTDSTIRHRQRNGCASRLHPLGE